MRRIAFLVHSVLGLKLSLLLLFVCATGTLAVVADELEWLLWDMARASDTERRVPWGRQLAAVRAAYPDHDVTYAVAGEEPYLSNRFELITPRGELRHAYVDPATGRVKGDAGFVTFQSALRALHYYLLLPGNWVVYLVTSLGLVLLISLLTGLVTFPRFWRRAFRRPRTDRGSRVFWGDFHRILGVWVGAFVLIIGGTSVWYMGEWFAEQRGVALEVERVGIPEERLDALGPSVPERLPLDTLLHRAERALPGLIVRHIWFPENPSLPLFVRGQATATLVRDRANGVQLDPYRGDVLSVHRAESLSPLRRWVHTADPLHFGDFGGLWSKLLWVVFGAALCLLMAAGAVIHARRGVRAVRGGRAPPSTRDLSSVLDFRHTGRWRWPVVILVLVAPVVSYFAWWEHRVGPRPPADTVLAERSVGPWSVSLATNARLPLEGGGTPAWRIRFCEGCYEQIREASLAYGDAEGPTGEPVPLLGSSNDLQAFPVVPGPSPDPDSEGAPRRLWLFVRSWSGSFHRVSWSLPSS